MTILLFPFANNRRTTNDIQQGIYQGIGTIVKKRWSLF